MVSRIQYLNSKVLMSYFLFISFMVYLYPAFTHLFPSPPTHFSSRSWTQYALYSCWWRVHINILCNLPLQKFKLLNFLPITSTYFLKNVFSYLLTSSKYETISLNESLVYTFYPCPILNIFPSNFLSPSVLPICSGIT
jgi:hypothetical protein